MGTALEVQSPPTAAPNVAVVSRPGMGLLRPVASVTDIFQAQEETRELIAKILKPGRDYGVIPGTDKPALLKPGAERITVAYGCIARYRILEKEIDHDRVVEWRKRRKVYAANESGKRDWTGEYEDDAGESLGLYRYIIECDLVHRESGVVVGNCLAACSTLESKYIDRPRDCENTVLKIGEKRSHAGAVLNAFGLSDQFTQDTDDNPEAFDPENQGKVSNEILPVCPMCSGPLWDNRKKKRSPRAPDFKCKDPKCQGVIWPGQRKAAKAAPAGPSGAPFEELTQEEEATRLLERKRAIEAAQAIQIKGRRLGNCTRDELSKIAMSQTAKLTPGLVEACELLIEVDVDRMEAERLALETLGDKAAPTPTEGEAAQAETQPSAVPPAQNL